MSAIIKYKCSNKNCGLDVSLNTHFPVWKEDAPKEKRKLPVGLAGQEYVAGYTNERACLSCKSIVEIFDTEASADFEYVRAKERWNAQNLFKKVKSLLMGIKPPQRSTTPKTTLICQECGAEDNFLTIGAKCHLCGEGEVVEDKGQRIMF